MKKSEKAVVTPITTTFVKILLCTRSIFIISLNFTLFKTVKKNSV